MIGACQNPPEPADFTFEASQGLYQLSSAESYLSASGSDFSEQVLVPAEILAPLFSSANLNQVEVNSDAASSQLSINLSGSTTSQSYVIPFSEFVPYEGPASPDGTYSQVIRKCTTDSRGTETCEQQPRTTAFSAGQPIGPSLVSEISNGCQVLTQEYVTLWFYENGTMTSDLYVSSSIDSFSPRTGIAIQCREHLVSVANRIRSGTPLESDGLFQLYLLNGAIPSVTSIPSLTAMQSGFLYDGVKVSSSSSAPGGASAPLLEASILPSRSGSVLNQSSNLDLASMHNAVVKALKAGRQ